MTKVKVKRFVGDKISFVNGTTEPGIDLIDLPLVVFKPMTVNFRGCNFKIDIEGLYRFADLSSWENENSYRNLIYYRSDERTLFASLCRLHVHGRADSGDFEKTAQTRVISTNCGPLHNFCMKIMKKSGMETRRVQLLTLSEWNDCDNGHVLLEYRCPIRRRWQALDLDTRSLFLDAEGSYMNVFELTQAVLNNQKYVIERICLTDGSDNYTSFDSFYADTHLLEESKKEWFSRIAQVPIMADGTRLFFPWDSDITKNRVLQYPSSRLKLTPLSQKQWLARFYPNDY